MRFILVFIIVLLSSCQSKESTRTIDMYNASGDMNGTATFIEEPDGVKIKLKVEGLTAGFHGIHVHENASCIGSDFKSAGNHFNPEGKKHGLMHPEGAHLGDLPNIEANSGGLVEAELVLDDATLLDGKNSILQGEGTSLVITEDKDDGISQPGGESGERILCGELTNNEKEASESSPTDPTDFDDSDSEGE